MGILSLFKNINLGFGMPHMPTTTSASTMEAKEYKEVEHDNKMSLAGDHNEITGVDKDKRLKNDEVSYHDLKRGFIGYPPKSSVPDCPYHLQTGFCTIGMDCKFNHPSREENVEGELEEAVSGLRRLAKFKGDQGPGHIASSENVGQIECKFYLLPGGCKYGNDCGFLHHVELNFLGLPIRPGEKKCPFYMRTGGCKFASRCRFHHPDPTAVDGHSFQDRKNGDPSQDHDPVEQMCETSSPSEKTSNEQTAYLGPFTPNRGLQQNVHWNGNQTVTSLLHPPEIKKFDEQQALANKDAAYEFSGGEPQQFDEYPQRPGKPECQYFMKTGYCKFNSACRYHHPKSNLSSLSLPLTPARNNYEQDGLVEQICEIPLPSENSSNDQNTFLCLSSSNVPDLFTPKQVLQPNVQWNGEQTVTSLLHPPEIKKFDEQQALANTDAAYEFSGGEPQQFDEYPQRPGKPECQYFMKTGYCKFNSACRYHHPKSNLSSLSLPLTPARNNYEKDGLVKQICEIPLPSENSSNDQSNFLCLSSSNVPDLFTPNQGLQPNVQWNGDQMATDPLHPPEIKMIEKNQELAYNDTAYEFNGDAKSQQFDEYPQRPGEPECQHFIQTGYCKFKSACRSHHPKSNLSFLSPPPKPDKPICTYYSRRGICKFGSACRYNHHTDHT